MDSFVVRGGNRLKGKIEISGSKNSALPIIAATLLAEGKTTLKGVPRLSDIDSMNKLIGELGCHVFRHEPNTSVTEGPALNGNLDIEVTDEKMCEARYDIVKTMRASICVLGPLLAKRGRAVVSIPGGCATSPQSTVSKPSARSRRCSNIPRLMRWCLRRRTRSTWNRSSHRRVPGKPCSVKNR